MIHVSNPRQNLYIGKLAKERHFTKLDEGVEDVERVSDHEYPFVTYIVDLHSQLVLIQKKTSVFHEPSSARVALEEVFRSVGDFGRYELVLAELTPEHQFWDYIGSAHTVQALHIILYGPNFQEDIWKGDDIAKKVQDAYGSIETEIRLKNEQGGLKIVQEIWNDMIRVVSAGCGRYFLKYKERKDGPSKTASSGMNSTAVAIQGEAEHLEIQQLEHMIAEVNNQHGGTPTANTTSPETEAKPRKRGTGSKRKRRQN